ALPWSIFKFSDDQEITPGRQHLDNFLKARLQNMEQQLTAKTWLTDSFTVADIAMADVLRLVNRFDGLEGYPACREYVVKATGRMAFKKAYADQMTFFAGKTKSE
ncbi:glutathione binding-like protein, partial [Pseudomaricurvus sp.]|uniref:glutathione binding-like protein n=1 Tax=Pseudomaricurvus sp. TaxID=2004510 RepID=UPI003F6D3EC9